MTNAPTKNEKVRLSPALSVIICYDAAERTYLDEHNNELLFAKRNADTDQWFVTLPPMVRETVPISGGIGSQYVYSVGALEHLALALRAEMIATGH